MKQRDLKPKAIKLRRQGYTLGEIQSQLGPIPKSTLSGWLKPIILSADQKARILKKSRLSGQIGRQLGAMTNHQKRLYRLEAIFAQAAKEYRLLEGDKMFLAGLVLYLAEGSKKSEIFRFMNSDYKLVKIMINWIVKFGNLTLHDMRFRLYIHTVYADENCEEFWQQMLGISPGQFLKTVFKPTIRKYKKNPSYNGCIRIEVRGSELYWKTMAWRDCLYDRL